MLRKCSKCAVLKELNNEFFYKTYSNKYGFEYECKECHKKRELNRKRKGRVATKEEKLKNRHKHIFRSYLKFDKRKNLLNNISEKYLLSQLSKPCSYCGFPSTGLDRVNNAIGHTINNCIPCCKECNIARMDNFSSEEMFILGKTIQQIKLKRQKECPLK